MNKTEFLQYLEKRLSVLNAKEREDIIQEYSQHIDMKVQSGLTEYEAIRDFGDLRPFVDEILEAYNINPQYEEINTAGVNNIISRIKGQLGRIAEFIFSQRPQVLIRMLIKILLVGGALFCIASMGFFLVYIFADWLSSYLPDIIPIAILGAYTIFAAVVGADMLYIYTKKLADRVRESKYVDTSFLKDIMRGINNIVNFTFAHKFTELVFMLFKIIVMAVVLFIIGLVGFIVPTIIDMFISNIIDINGILEFIYLVIAIVTGIYILINYIIRLANSMNKDIDFESEKTSGVLESKTTSINGGQCLIPDFFNSINKFIKLILHFSWRAVVILFRLSVIAGLAMFTFIFVPAIVFMGFALVFMLLGYPVIGIFLASVGFCISATALILIVIKLVFSNGTKEKRESI